MKHWSIHLLVATLLVSAGFFAGREVQPVSAQTQPETMDYRWGGVVGVTADTLILQDSTNDIRFVDLKTLKVKRQINRQ
jgi:hypothetical protein